MSLKMSGYRKNKVRNILIYIKNVFLEKIQYLFSDTQLRYRQRVLNRAYSIEVYRIHPKIKFRTFTFWRFFWHSLNNKSCVKNTKTKKKVRRARYLTGELQYYIVVYCARSFILRKGVLDFLIQKDTRLQY